MADFRAELAALVAAYDEHRKWTINAVFERLRQAVEHARDVLAQPGPETPTDKELLEMMPQPFRDDLALVSRIAAHGAGPDIKPGLFRVSLNTGALDFARAVLARWGAADKEAAERALRPIPVSERLPGPEDFDTEGRCWFYTPASSVLYAYWVLREPDSLRKWETHWLPAHALPLPEVNQ